MIAAQLPVLQVVIPLIAAPLCVIAWRGWIAWTIAFIVSWATLAIAAMLFARVVTEGPFSYLLGGWLPPWGIEYRIDYLSAFVLLVVTGIAATVVPYMAKSVRAQFNANRQNLFYTAFLLALTGLLGIVITGDAFNLYVFLEISSLASYVLIAQYHERRGLVAAYQYLVLGTIGATLILIGIGLLYMMTGTLNMADLSLRIPELTDRRPIHAAFAFLTVGISLKLALFPLHLWLPNAYAFAPSAVSAFLAATATKVGAYVLLRFVFTVFGVEFAFEVMPLGEILMPLALIAVFAGSLVAIYQTNVKRLLAYSSVAQIGYIALGISFASTTGLTGSVVHLLNHALMKGGLFLAVGCVAYRMGGVELSNWHGLGRRMPFTMAAVALGGLSLVGVPLTVGFVSKWYLVAAAIEGRLWPVAALVLVSSLLALAYMGRIIEAAYFHPPAEGSSAKIAEAPLTMLLPTWVLIGLCVYFGIDTDLTVGMAERIASYLLTGAP
jgi:multicomponent Na+:H+ antiporter subunit D